MNKLRVLMVLCCTAIVLLLLCSTCCKEHVAPINQLVKDLFCFKTGSEWTYYDSVSQTMQKMVVTNYETTRMAPKPEGGRKAYNFAEYIEMEIIVSNFNRTTRLEADIEQDNTLGRGCIYPPIGEPLYIGCDKNNNFIPPITYLSSYSVNETTYTDVYMFNVVKDITADNYTYYVSKHIGFIRCIFQCEYAPHNNFDLVLIDKKVQQ